MSAQTALETRAIPPHPGTATGGSTVKRTLTRKRRRAVVENDSYAAFTRRILRAYARRISGDIDALVLITDLSAEVEAAIGQAVTGLRAHGYSWAEIAARLGVTRQAAQQRWGAHPSP